MLRCLYLILLLAAGACSAVGVTDIDRLDPSSQPAPQPLLLPTLGELPALRAAQESDADAWNLIAGSHSAVVEGNLVFDAPPGELAYAVLDLGKVTTNYVSFVPENAILPMSMNALAWVGMSDYGRGCWRWAELICCRMDVEFDGDPRGFPAPDYHSYIVIVVPGKMNFGPCYLRFGNLTGWPGL